MNLRAHKRRAASGMTRRLAKTIRNGLRYGPACHPFTTRCQWSLSQQTAWHPWPPRLFQNDRTTVDYSRRSCVRGHEHALNIQGAATAARRRGDRLLRQWNQTNT